MTSSADTKPDLPRSAGQEPAAWKLASAGVPWIEDAGVPMWRKPAAKALVALAWMLGAAMLAIYVYVVWSDPPDFSRSSAAHELKGAEFLYLFLPLVLLFGPVWAASWLAKRIDPSRTDDASDD